MWLKILQIILVPIVDKLWDLVEGWIKEAQAKQEKKNDDKETADELDSIHNGGRPSAD